MENLKPHLKEVLGLDETDVNRIRQSIRNADTFWVRLLISAAAILLTFFVLTSSLPNTEPDFVLNFVSEIIGIVITIYLVDWVVNQKNIKKRATERQLMESELRELPSLLAQLDMALLSPALRTKYHDKNNVDWSDLFETENGVPKLSDVWEKHRRPFLQSLGHHNVLENEELFRLGRCAKNVADFCNSCINLFGPHYESYILTYLLITRRRAMSVASGIESYLELGEQLLSFVPREYQDDPVEAEKNLKRNLYHKYIPSMVDGLVSLFDDLLKWRIYLTAMDGHQGSLLKFWRQFD